MIRSELMKKQSIIRTVITTIVLFAVSMNLQAQSMQFYGANSQYIGRVESDGRIYNSSSRNIGRIDSDGKVYNGSSSYIGKVESDGRVYNSSSSYIGKVESDGRVYNSTGSHIGRANGSPIKKEWVAAFYFFFSGTT